MRGSLDLEPVAQQVEHGGERTDRERAAGDRCRRDVDGEPVGVQSRHQRADGAVEHDHGQPEHGHEEAGDEQAEPADGVPADQEDVRRGDRERAGDRELVHAAPRHPLGREAARDHADRLDAAGRGRSARSRSGRSGPTLGRVSPSSSAGSPPMELVGTSLIDRSAPSPIEPVRAPSLVELVELDGSTTGRRSVAACGTSSTVCAPSPTRRCAPAWPTRTRSSRSTSRCCSGAPASRSPRLVLPPKGLVVVLLGRRWLRRVVRSQGRRHLVHVGRRDHPRRPGRARRPRPRYARRPCGRAPRYDAVG